MRAGTSRCTRVESQFRNMVHSFGMFDASLHRGWLGQGAGREHPFRYPVSFDRLIIGLVVQSLIASMRILIPV
jgi:hypothetical protein